jgi:hypothetical protein
MLVWNDKMATNNSKGVERARSKHQLIIIGRMRKHKAQVDI